MKRLIALLSILFQAQAVFAQEFRLAVISASDLRELAPAPVGEVQAVAELSGMDEREAAAYLADREDQSGADEKAVPGEPAAADLGGDGFIKLYHEWNKEVLAVRYRGADGRYLPEALAKVRHFMRCRLTGREADIPARLLEIIDAIQERHGDRTITVICGYRSPELNGALASDSSGVAKKSLHLKGWAADIKIEGVRTSALRNTARALRAGGVGYYPSDGFVHVDTGRVRYW
ncbi:MAG: hypothetical protein A2179_03105 [Elusimicrobia bacterium GWC2_63_65]|nr:MAG: hypothetical protein A2179_03105 [Elusimicrobia bacterium GWC2_63_65]